MMKFILIAVFYAWLLIPSSLSGDVIAIQFWPFGSPLPMRSGSALFLFANLGVLVTVALALFDQFQLRMQNKKLRKLLDTVQKEVVSLREDATMEREET